jgi:hypothetical protein
MFLTILKTATAFKSGESIEFSGKCVVALAQDKNIMKYSTKCIIAADYAQSHGIRDTDGRKIESIREVGFLISYVLPENLKFITNFIPSFIKVPQFVLDIVNSKF